SAELAMAPLLLLSAIRFNELPCRSNFFALLLTILAAMLLCYPSVFLLPAVMIFLVRPKAGSSIDRRCAKPAIIVAIWSSAVFLLLYWVVMRHNVNKSLWLWFAERYPAVGVLAHFRKFCLSLFEAYPQILPIPMRILDSPVRLIAILGTLTLMGVLAIYQLRRNGRHWVALAVALPLISVSFASALSLYPASDRTTLFLLPC